MIVHDDFAIVKKDGDTFLTFMRPKPEGSFLARSAPSGAVVITPTTDNIMAHKAELGTAPADKNVLFLYLAPNWAFQGNALLIYKYTSVITNNQVIDVRYALNRTIPLDYSPVQSITFS
jgi:hypothetical protein